MNKYIIFSLLLMINTVNYGMKRKNNNEIVILNNDKSFLIPDDVKSLMMEGLCFYQSLCLYHNYNPNTIKNDIRALSDTNTFFHNYYGQEKIKQGIIRLCSNHLNSTDKDIADKLKCRKIAEKIKHFTNIACNEKLEFTTQDLSEKWYLNIHTNIYNKFLQKDLQQSLLQITINNRSLKKAFQILDNTEELTFYYHQQKNLLYNITETRAHMIEYDFFPNNKKLNALLAIARTLLEKNFFVDGRINKKQKTALMQAVTREDKELVHLFLEYGADPYAEYKNSYSEKIENAFDMEPEHGWLSEIMDEIEENKKGENPLT